MSIAITLQVEKRHIYIIGGGKVALRKAKRWLSEGAFVHVVAPTILSDFPQHEHLYLHQQVFTMELFHEDIFLLYAATSDEALNHQIILEAKAHNILCGSANQDECCDIHSMHDQTYEHLHVAISTRGYCPGADRMMLSQLTPMLEELDQKSMHLGSIRDAMPNIQTDVIAQLAQLEVTTIACIAECYVQHKNMLILTYHGIANKKDALPSLQQMEKKVQQRFPNDIVTTCFLSEKITKKAKQKGFSIDVLSNIVPILIKLQIPCFLQPMLLHKGEWSATLQAGNMQCGTSLLSNEDDVTRLYDILKKKYPKHSLLGIYHDTSALLSMQQKQTNKDQFLPLSQLTFYDDANLQVVPLFVLLGYHAKNDIEAHISAQCAYHKKGLLEYDEIQLMFLQKIVSDIENLEFDKKLLSSLGGQ